MGRWWVQAIVLYVDVHANEWDSDGMGVSVSVRPLESTNVRPNKEVS